MSAIPQHRRTHEEERHWLEYERLKAEWRRAHPNASAQVYEAAMRKIAAEVGV